MANNILQSEPTMKDLTTIPRRAMYPLDETCVLLGGISMSGLHNQIKAGVIRTTYIGNRVFVTDGEINRISKGGDDV